MRCNDATFEYDSFGEFRRRGKEQKEASTMKRNAVGTTDDEKKQ